MNLTDDEILKFQKGTPILLDDICAVYPAKLGEIVDEGYSNFQQYLGLLTSSKPEVSGNNSEFNKLTSELSDFQYMLLVVSLDAKMKDIFQRAFYFFLHESVTFSLEPAQIYVGEVKEHHIINEEKFYELQTLLRRMYFLEQEGEEIIINPDDSPAVIKLKKQMRANREKVRKAKAKQNSGHSDLKLSDLIGSITLDNCGLNMENVFNITYYAFHDQLKRMGWRDQFNINNQAALAGAKLKKNQLKHWMRSIADSDKS